MSLAVAVLIANSLFPKQRISLARAVYNDGDVYIMDDPLSAVDANVGDHIFHQIVGSNGLLKDKTRLLVTHSIQYLSNVDFIIVMEDGQISQSGTYEQLLKSHGAFSKFLKETTVSKRIEKPMKDHQKFYILNNDTQISSPIATLDNGDVELNELNKDKYALVKDEEMSLKNVKFDIYLYYLKSLSIWYFILSLMLYLFDYLFLIGQNIWLSVWSTSSIENSYYQNLAIYCLMGVMQSVMLLIGIVILTLRTLKASIVLHGNLSDHILFSTMEFFDTTPVGRILNRFSKDIDDIDIMIPQFLKQHITEQFVFLSTLALICYSDPILILVILPVLGLFLMVQKYYLIISRGFKRLVSVTRSPINSCVTECVTGVSVIRAFGMESSFYEKFDEKYSINIRSQYGEIMSNAWLYGKLMFLANIIIIACTLVNIIDRDSSNPGKVGLGLTYAFSIQSTVFYLIRTFSDLEKSMVAVERIKEYQNTPLEAPFENPKHDSNIHNWPSKGIIKFEKYSTRYRPGMDLVLKSISFQTKSMEKIGIVGRTGAGKSSLALSLFRIIESVSECIYIDGVDIANLGLRKLRSAMTIIPQVHPK